MVIRSCAVALLLVAGGCRNYYAVTPDGLCEIARQSRGGRDIQAKTSEGEPFSLAPKFRAHIDAYHVDRGVTEVHTFDAPLEATVDIEKNILAIDGGAKASFPLPDVKKVEVSEYSPGKTAGLVVGVTIPAVTAIVVGAIFAAFSRIDFGG